MEVLLYFQVKKVVFKQLKMRQEASVVPLAYRICSPRSRRTQTFLVGLVHRTASGLDTHFPDLFPLWLGRATAAWPHPHQAHACLQFHMLPFRQTSLVMPDACSERQSGSRPAGPREAGLGTQHQGGL